MKLTNQITKKPKKLRQIIRKMKKQAKSKNLLYNNNKK